MWTVFTFEFVTIGSRAVSPVGIPLSSVLAPLLTSNDPAVDSVEEIIDEPKVCTVPVGTLTVTALVSVSLNISKSGTPRY